MSRRDLTDLEQQVAEANRATRDEYRAAHTDDPGDYFWIGGRAIPFVDGPDTADRYEP